MLFLLGPTFIISSDLYQALSEGFPILSMNYECFPDVLLVVIDMSSKGSHHIEIRSNLVLHSYPIVPLDV